VTSYVSWMKTLTDFPSHEFTLYLDGPDSLMPANFDALYEAGCDDALFGYTLGRQTAEFVRRAPTLRVAVESAIAQVEHAVPDLRVTQIELDDRPALPLRKGIPMMLGLTRCVVVGEVFRHPQQLAFGGLRGLASEVVPWPGYDYYQASLNDSLAKRMQHQPLNQAPGVYQQY
jgi:hypothetical protein